mmetsp:Transcript_21378/g.52621  ORF Transcript_21378/g.52621 Transcript_21378/m.52621 type:complete len:119 (+) Transcript_21378:649-1005(+)
MTLSSQMETKDFTPSFSQMFTKKRMALTVRIYIVVFGGGGEAQLDHQQQPQAKEAAAKSWILPFRHVRYGCHSNHHYYYQSLQMPHILLLDEPTTNLDIETICVMLSTSSMEVYCQRR